MLVPVCCSVYFSQCILLNSTQYKLYITSRYINLFIIIYLQWQHAGTTASGNSPTPTSLLAQCFIHLTTGVDLRLKIRLKIFFFFVDECLCVFHRQLKCSFCFSSQEKPRYYFVVISEIQWVVLQRFSLTCHLRTLLVRFPHLQMQIISISH